jgi:hypothetical protein
VPTYIDATCLIECPTMRLLEEPPEKHPECTGKVRRPRSFVFELRGSYKIHASCSFVRSALRTSSYSDLIDSYSDSDLIDSYSDSDLIDSYSDLIDSYSDLIDSCSDSDLIDSCSDSDLIDSCSDSDLIDSDLTSNPVRACNELVRMT